jgi:CheY-like chemotaxis protein
MAPREPLTLLSLPDPERAKPCVLVIDDDEAVYEAIRARLGADFHVVGITDPKDAVETARREQPDVILCDINMPDVKGDEVAYALSEDPDTNDIPLIYLTALVDPHDTSELDGLFGDHPAVSKSASPAELRDIVGQVLGLPPD